MKVVVAVGVATTSTGLRDQRYPPETDGDLTRDTVDVLPVQAGMDTDLAFGIYPSKRLGTFVAIFDHTITSAGGGIPAWHLAGLYESSYMDSLI